MPGVLDLSNKAVLVLLSALLNLLTGRGQVVGELVRVPAIIGLGDIVVPVLLDKVGQVLTIGRGRVRDIVVG